MEGENSNIKLIIGLGNPGKEYENTYHNIGHLCADFLKQNLAPTKYKIMKADTFMNKSGDFVKEKMEELKIDPENILIIHDDSDIKLGDYKFSKDKSSAGHKGIQSIIEKLETKNFSRLRIGVRDEDEKRKAEEFVLEKIKIHHSDEFEDIFWEIMKELKSY